jgi:hypothetical protein
VGIEGAQGGGFGAFGAESQRSVSFWSGSGPSSQKRGPAGTEKSREALVECDDAIASRTVGLVPNDAVGKVAAARKHRDPGLGGGTLDIDCTDGRCPDRRNAPRRLLMSSRAAAATSSIRPFSNNATLTLAPGVTPRWFSTARRRVTCPFAVTVSSSAIDTPSR